VLPKNYRWIKAGDKVCVGVWCNDWAANGDWESEGRRDDSNDGAHSPRQIMDEKWRALPWKGILISDMECYAAGLGDKELWQELEKEFGDWLNVDGGGKRFDQPRFAIFLARELGKRNRECGLSILMKWRWP
jgi:hypothetical protein